MSLVSIIMPAYNAGRTILNAIQSVQSQTHRNFELIIVDDGSGDGTYEKAKDVASADSRIRVFKLDRNSGSPAAPRNIGLQNARGRFVAFLDADDKWRPLKLERQIAFMTEVGAKISCTGYDVYDEWGEFVGKLVPPVKHDYKGLLRENTIGCLTAMLDLEKLGPIQFPVCGHEDYALWLSVLREGGYVYGLQEQLAEYRVSSSSVSGNKFKVLPYFWGVYRKAEGFSIVRSGYYCARYAWYARNKYKKSA